MIDNNINNNLNICSNQNLYPLQMILVIREKDTLMYILGITKNIQKRKKFYRLKKQLLLQI